MSLSTLSLVFDYREKMDQVLIYVKPLKDFSKDSMRLVKRCTKPDLKGKKHFFLCAFIIFFLFM